MVYRIARAIEMFVVAVLVASLLMLLGFKLEQHLEGMITYHLGHKGGGN